MAADLSRYNKMHVAAGSPSGGQFGSSSGSSAPKSSHPAAAKATAAKSGRAAAVAQHKADRAAASAQKQADRMKAFKAKLRDSRSPREARAALGGANLAELQQLAADLKLSAEGDKPALINRIAAHRHPSLLGRSRAMTGGRAHVLEDGMCVQCGY